MSERLPERVVASVRNGKILGVRCGTKAHRMIGIWAVVVDGRVFVRSWSLTPGGWYRTLREERVAVIQIGAKRIPVRAAFTRSERLKDLVSRAYLEKYKTPGSVRYARDLSRKKSRETTTEFVPRARGTAARPRAVGGRRGSSASATARKSPNTPGAPRGFAGVRAVTPRFGLA